MTVIGFALLFAIAGMISLGLAIFCWRRRDMPGATAFSLTMLLLAVWPLVQAIDVFTADLNLKILLMKIRLDAPAFSAVFSLLMIVELTSQTELLTRRRTVLLFVIPSVGIVLNWASPNLLFRYGFYVDYPSGLLPVLRWSNGPLFWVWIMYIFGLYIFQIYLLIRSRRGVSSLSFIQILAIFASTVLMLVVNAAFQFGISPIPGFNLTPAVQALMGLIVTWAIFQYRIFEIVPLARASIFEQMRDGVIVLNKEKHVMDMNPAAVRILGLVTPLTVGKKVDDIFAPWPHLKESLYSRIEMKEFMDVGTGEGRRKYEFSLSPLYDQQDLFTGCIITLRFIQSESNATPEFLPDDTPALIHSQPKGEKEAKSELSDEVASKQRIRLVDWLVDFFFPKLRTDLETPPGLSPDWFTAVERTFTQVLRFSLLLSPVDIFFSEVGLLNSPRKLLILFLLEVFFYVLAVVRTIPFRIRAIGFLFLLYIYGVKEVATVGYSAESFMFFIIFIVGSGFLLRGKNGWAALLISLIPLGFFGWQIKTGSLIPEGMSTTYYLTLPSLFPFPNMLSFLISAVGLNITLVATWENWHRAWQKEGQARNLLQQERDLLDQRVQERSHNLAEAEAKYRVLVENLPFVVYRDLADRTGTTTYVSPAVETLLGYSALEWSRNPHFWDTIVYPEDMEIAATSANDVVDQEYSEVEYRVHAHDGRTVWIRDICILVRSESGQPLYVQGTLQDITDRKLASEQLQEAQDLFKHVVENIQEVFWLTDPISNKDLYISPAAEKIWGRTVEELIHDPNSFLNSILEEDRPIAVNALKLQSQGQGTDIKYRVIRPDGAIRWVWDRATVVPDESGRAPRVAGFALDVTDSIQINAALEHSAAQYRELFEDSPVSLWEEDFSEVKLFLNLLQREGVTDFKTYLEAHPEVVIKCAELVKIVNVNQSSLRLYHACSKEELIGSLSTIFDEENIPNFIMELTNIAEGKTDFEWLGENLTLLKERLIVNIQWSVVTGYEDTLSRVIVSVVDVSKEKEVEKILQRQSEQYAALSQIAIDLLNNRNLDELLQLAAEKTAQLLDAPYCGVVLLEGGRLVLRASTGYPSFILGNAFGRDEGKLSWQAIDTGKPAIYQQYYDWAERTEIYDGLRLHSVAEFPIIINGVCIGALGAARDVSGYHFDEHHVKLGEWLAQLIALVLNNAQLMENTKLQVAALNTTANAIVITDRSGLIQWVNPSFASLTGYTFEEAIGKNPRILQSGHTPKELYKDLWGTILSGKTWRGEVTNRHKSGRDYFEAMTITPLRDEHGDIYRFVAIKEDVTLRRTADQLLRESEEKFRSIIEYAINGVALTDEQGMVVEWNPAQENIFGLKREEVIGRPLWEIQFQLVPPERRTSTTYENIKKIFEQILATGEAPEYARNQVIIFPQKDIGERIVRSSVFSVKTSLGFRFAGFSEDITERRQMEQLLRESEERYRSMVNVLSEGIVLYDQNGVVMTANQAAQEILGLTLAQMIGSTSMDNQWRAIDENGEPFPPEAYPALQTLRTGKQESNVIMGIHKPNGVMTWISINSQPILNMEKSDSLSVVVSFIDITEQKNATDYLRMSEEKYRLIYENMEDVVYQTDYHGIITAISPSVTRHAGYGPDELLGKHAELFYAFPEEFAALDALIVSQGIVNDYEVRIREKEGSLIYVSLTIRTIFDSNGRPIGTEGVMRNISERKAAEERLRLSEEKYRLIYENMEDVVYQTDYDGFITAISPSIARQSGYSADELIGKHASLFYSSPSELETLAELIRVQGKVNDYEGRIKRKDGSLVYVSFTSRIIFGEDGRPIGTEGVIRDITERKAAEARILQMNADLEARVVRRTAEIQTSNKYLSVLLETALILNKSLDINEIFDHILTQAQKIIPSRGINLMMIEGQDAAIVRRAGYVREEDREQHLMEFKFSLSMPNFRKMLSTGQSVYIPDTVIDPDWQNNPSSAWIRTYVGIPLLISEKVIGFLNFSHDQPSFFQQKDILLLEALANHASIAIQNANLLENIKSSLEKEQNMRDQLVHADKLAALGKMVAVIAHEINNPIQTVKNTLYLLEDQIIPDSPAVEYLKMASTEANRISDLVSQLRETYRARSKTFVRVNVLTLLEEVKSLLYPQMKKSRVEWMQSDDFLPCFVFAIRNNLKQVFINLCLNAIEAMSEDNGGQLKVNLNFKVDKRWVGVEFHNTGPLIPQEALDHIFEPFFTTKGYGSGLGLSICYDIVKQHSGEITVESYPQTGVIFTVWLSIAPNQETG